MKKPMTLFPSRHEFEITSFILLFAFGLSLGIFLCTLTRIDNEAIITAITTLIATFSGAFFAFNLNEKKKEKELDEKNIRAGNKLQFELINLYNSFNSYENQFIRKYKFSPARHIKIRPAIGLKDLNFSIDFESIMYLVDSESPELLQELSTFQLKFTSTLELLQSRDDYFLTVISPCMSGAGVSHGSRVTLSDVEKIIGENYSNIMMEFTDQLIESIEELIEESKYLIAKMFRTHSKRYKGFRFLNMQI